MGDETKYEYGVNSMGDGQWMVRRYPQGHFGGDEWEEAEVTISALADGGNAAILKAIEVGSWA